MQFQHSQEQFLKVSTVCPSTSFLPHQGPSSGHSIYRALGQGINPSLMTPSAGGGLRAGGGGGGEKSVKRERSQQDLIRLGFSCEWTKPIQNYETSGDPSLFIHSQSFWFCSFGNRVGEQHSTLVVCTLMRDGGISHGRLDREGEKKSTESSWLFILLLLPDKAYSFLPIPAAEAKADTA